MTSKAYRDGYDLIDWKPLKSTASRETREQRAAGPYFIPDIAPYRSPIDGSVVGGRRQHRDHMRAHGVIEVGNEKPVPFKPKPLPSIADSVREAAQMLNNGYRPRLDAFNPNEFD